MSEQHAVAAEPEERIEAEHAVEAERHGDRLPIEMVRTWSSTIPLTPQITRGTRFCIHPLFPDWDDISSDCRKRGEVAWCWPQLFDAVLYFDTKYRSHFGRLIGFDAKGVTLQHKGDPCISLVEWEHLLQIGTVEPVEGGAS